MAEKKEKKQEKDPFSDSSEIFESIFKEATQEIQKETGRVIEKPSLKPKPEAKQKPAGKPKAPTKLELEAEPERKAEQERKPRSEPKSRLQPPVFKPRQETVRRTAARPSGPDEEKTQGDLLSTHPLMRSPLREQEPKEESNQKPKKPMPSKKKGKGSSVLTILLLLILLAVGVGAASVYFGILDLSEYLGGREPARKEAPKVAATKPPQAQTATKPAQPATPKAPQPSHPQAKPAEAPKPPAQTVQPPQAPPKPTETARPPQPTPPPAPPAVASPKPTEFQATPVPPAPPAVAKAETPSQAVQPPAKVETPPPPAQPNVKSQPEAPPPPPAPPVVKSEPKAPPAPVQAPTVPKKMEPSQPASQQKQIPPAQPAAPVIGSGVSYPFSVYLGSFQNQDYLKRALSIYEKEGLSSYWTKVELGAKGTWYRVFTGYFRSAQEAEAFIQQKRIKDGEVKETRYSNLIGTFGTKQEGEEKVLALTRMGLSAYGITGADGQVRVYSGAFTNREGAEKNQAELNSKGIKNQVAER